MRSRLLPTSFPLLSILLGGGLALASGMKTTGVAEYIGQTISGFQHLPTVVMVLLVTTTVVFVTELSSNVATIAAFGPIFAALAVSMGQSPLLLLIPTTIGTSFAFMMPVATPPNAIVFGTGRVPLTRMMRTGALIDLVTVGVVWTGMQLLAPLLPR